MAKVLTTTDLISSIKRRASIPTNQKLFSTQDFIDILNEQLNTYIMPFIMEQHEEFFVNFVDLPLVKNKTHYKIPDRAIGNKIREVVYKDDNGNFTELSLISLEDLEDYQNDSNLDYNSVFYLENNNIVLLASSEGVGSLRMYYYLQPNTLVDNELGMSITSVNNPTLILSTKTNTTVSKTSNPSFTAGTGNDIGTDDDITITGHGLASGAKIRVSGSSLPTELIADTDYWVIVIDDNTIKLADNFSNSIATVPTPKTITETGSGLVNVEVITGVISFNSAYPATFTALSKYDLISGKSPSNILNYDITPVDLDSTARVITFNVEDMDINLESGDYIYLRTESPVPQVPLEVQALLTQAAAVYCLESMGDKELLEAAIRKQQMLETNLRGVLNNRTEGSPKKIINKNGIIRDSVRGSVLGKRF